MGLEEYVRQYVKRGYELNDARSKVEQDIILTKICKSDFKEHITVKGGVVIIVYLILFVVRRVI